MVRAIASITMAVVASGAAQELGKTGGRKDPVLRSVCQLLRDPTAYEGQRLFVRGIFRTYEHGSFLQSGDCKGLHTEPWAPVVTLTVPHHPFLKPHIEGLVLDAARMDEFYKAVDLLKRRNPNADIWATFHGVFRAKVRILKLGSKEVPLGYGHQGAARAQLVYEYAENPSNEQGPTQAGQSPQQREGK